MAVLDHIGDARGGAGVVLQHQEGAGFVAHDIGAADMHIGVERHVEADHRLAVAGVLQHQFGRDDLVGEDLPLVVDVAQEHVQRPHALGDAGFDLVPFRRGDHPRDQVERQDAVDRGGVGIDREGDAAFQQVTFGILRTPPQAVDRQCRQPRQQQGQGGMLRLAGPQHLAEERARVIALHRAVGLQLALTGLWDWSDSRHPPAFASPFCNAA